MPASVPPLAGISSMATRGLLAELADAWRERSGQEVRFESLGGVEAAQRVRAGDAFDVIVLAADALAALAADGHVPDDSQTALARSDVMIAVRAGAPRPDVSTEAALRAAVLNAQRIGYSTGPSGVALMALFARWGVADALAYDECLVQARPGVPVGRLLAEGAVSLGFQQRSELMRVPGIDLLGAMPPGCEITTIFSAGLCAARMGSTASTTCAQTAAARAFIAFMAAPAAAPVKRRHGMEPA